MKIHLNDLPRYSKWPARLLNEEEWKVKKKNRSELEREYEVEKYGAFLKQVDEKKLRSSIDVTYINNHLNPPTEKLLYSIGSDLYYGNVLEAHHQYNTIIKDTFTFPEPPKNIVELGCGYGRIILSLMEDKSFSESKFQAAEYARSGIALTKLCAENMKLNLEVGWCDFFEGLVKDIQIPKNSVIFTHMATTSIPILPDIFLESLLALEPQAILFLENSLDSLEGEDLLTLMRRAYIRQNDYNTNLLTLIESFQEKGKCKLTKVKHNLAGWNPLLPVSLFKVTL